MIQWFTIMFVFVFVVASVTWWVKDTRKKARLLMANNRRKEFQLYSDEIKRSVEAVRERKKEYEKSRQSFLKRYNKLLPPIDKSKRDS